MTTSAGQRTYRAKSLSRSRWRPEGIYFEAQDQFSSRKQTAIAASKQALQRERRRNNQRRYRHKQIALTTNLEIETDHLRDEINQLKRHRSDIAASIPTKENVWYFVVEYFRLFRYGLRNVVRTPSRSTQNTQYNDQLSYVQVELDEIKKGAADSLLATSTTSITIQERTLRSVFPHLCIDMDDSPLAKILVGQRIQMRGWTCFEWDPTFGRVTCITNVADLLTPTTFRWIPNHGILLLCDITYLGCTAAFSVALSANAKLVLARHELYGPQLSLLLALEESQAIADKVSQFILADEESNMDIDDIEKSFELKRNNLFQYMFAVSQNYY
ncbi:hypothetical protein GN244_ATG15326 [Phytophthora infestans]|uniref:BZIP domain-containing protein n=1 Tax=Phytophthora infestans TaxID=4787 RepID=A0A833T2U8_PHYIN|nr:hypothetical protein GN244_ATG15326 [Phytophthora infestans]